MTVLWFPLICLGWENGHVSWTLCSATEEGWGGSSEVGTAYRGMIACAFATIINMSPHPGIASYLGRLLPIRSTPVRPIQDLPAMPYRFRNSTRVANSKPTSLSAASSVTLEQNQNEPTLGTSETRRPKRGIGGSSEGIAGKFHLPRKGNPELMSFDSPKATLDEKPASQRRKKRRLIQSKDLSLQPFKESWKLRKPLMDWISAQSSSHHNPCFQLS